LFLVTFLTITTTTTTTTTATDIMSFDLLVEHSSKQTGTQKERGQKKKNLMQISRNSANLSLSLSLNHSVRGRTRKTTTENTVSRKHVSFPFYL
jgi:hypothetical protein